MDHMGYFHLKGSHNEGLNKISKSETRNKKKHKSFREKLFKRLSAKEKSTESLIKPGSSEHRSKSLDNILDEEYIHRAMTSSDFDYSRHFEKMENKTNHSMINLSEREILHKKEMYALECKAYSQNFDYFAKVDIGPVQKCPISLPNSTIHTSTVLLSKTISPSQTSNIDSTDNFNNLVNESFKSDFSESILPNLEFNQNSKMKNDKIILIQKESHLNSSEIKTNTLKSANNPSKIIKESENKNLISEKPKEKYRKIQKPTLSIKTEPSSKSLVDFDTHLARLKQSELLVRQNSFEKFDKRFIKTRGSSTELTSAQLLRKHLSSFPIEEESTNTKSAEKFREFYNSRENKIETMNTSRSGRDNRSRDRKISQDNSDKRRSVISLSRRQSPDGAPSLLPSDIKSTLTKASTSLDKQDTEKPFNSEKPLSTKTKSQTSINTEASFQTNSKPSSPKSPITFYLEPPNLYSENSDSNQKDLEELNVGDQMAVDEESANKFLNKFTSNNNRPPPPNIFFQNLNLNEKPEIFRRNSFDPPRTPGGNKYFERTFSFTNPGQKPYYEEPIDETGLTTNKTVIPISPRSPKTSKRQTAVELSKSLESGLESTLNIPKIQTLDIESPTTFINNIKTSLQNESTPVFIPEKPKSYPKYNSFPSVISDPPMSPVCDSPCSNPTKLIHKIVRRLSIRRKAHKEEKKNSVDYSRKDGKEKKGSGDFRGSTPVLIDSTPRQRKSLQEVQSSLASSVGYLTEEDENSTIENEGLYRGLLRCLLHPLGSPDQRVGYRPGDLVDHIREVFQVEREDHESFITDECRNKPTKVQANVNIIEGKDIANTERYQYDSLYCVLILTNKHSTHSSPHTKSSPKLSPHHTPHSSPQSSPQLGSKKLTPPRSPSFENDVLRTQGSKCLRNPRWNERFNVDVDEMTNEELHVYVCQQDDNMLPADAVKPEKNRAFRGFFKSMLQSSTDHEKTIPGCIGRLVLPLQDIPSEGCEKWYDLVPVCSNTKSKSAGQIRVHVSLTAKQPFIHPVFYSSEDYHLASLLVHRYAAASMKDTDGLDFSLPPQSRRIINIFATSNGISKLSQNIMDLTVLLELVLCHQCSCITDNVLHRALEEVQITWSSMQIGGRDYLQKMPLCDAEISLYRTSTRRYIEAVIDGLTTLPRLFPPHVDSIHVIKTRLGISQHLLELDLWDFHTSPQTGLANALTKKLQEDVRIWMETNLDTIHVHSQVKDVVIPEVESLVDMTNLLTNTLTPLGLIDQFYSGLGVSYYRIVTFEAERKLSAKARELMMGLDKYQIRYHNFHDNLNASCRLSIKLYFAVRTFFQVIKENICERDMFRLTIPSYQDWFQEAVVFWLHVFRSECTSRIQRALEIDKDFVLVTSLVKYSNSSVDAQSCFSEIAAEWRRIDIHDPETAVMGITKITDMICDGSRIYSSKIQTILERNCYYDQNEGQFDVTDRMCITLNNIEHVRCFLSELPERLDWEEVTTSLSVKLEDPRVGEKSLATLYRLIKNALEDILHMSARVLRSICDKMSIEVHKYIECFLIKSPEKPSATDKVIGYLNANLDTLNKKLSETIYPHMTSELWIMVLQLFDTHLPVGKSPEFYEQQLKHLRSMTLFFQSCCANCQSSQNCLDLPQVDKLKQRLDINSCRTEKLMLSYFDQLSQHMGTPVDYLGHLAIKAAYMEETRGNITIYVKVIQGIDLPGLDNSGLSDPYVVVSLQPDPLFNVKHQRTKTIDQTLQPVFNTTFQFPNIPKEYLSEAGAVLLLSVMDFDRVKCDDFAGEVVISLDSLQQLKINEAIDKAPVVMMPLKRPTLDHDGPFQVLCDRSSWDKCARQFIQHRRRFIDNQPERTDTVKDKLSSFFKFLSGKTTEKENIT